MPLDPWVLCFLGQIATRPQSSPYSHSLTSPMRAVLPRIRICHHLRAAWQRNGSSCPWEGEISHCSLAHIFGWHQLSSKNHARTTWELIESKGACVGQFGMATFWWKVLQMCRDSSGSTRPAWWFSGTSRLSLSLYRYTYLSNYDNYAHEWPGNSNFLKHPGTQ